MAVRKFFRFPGIGTGNAGYPVVPVLGLFFLIFLFVPAVAAISPTFTGIVPASGSTAGGTSVIITGTAFTGATGVTFGGIPAADVTVVDDTSIAATTPAYASAGRVNVVITTPNGTVTAFGAYAIYPAPAAPLPANNPGIVAPIASRSYTMGFPGLSYTVTGNNTLVINKSAAQAAGATVTMYPDRVEVYQHNPSGILITFWGNDFTGDEGNLTGPVSHAVFLTDPLNATLAFGNVTGSVQATLPALTRPVSIGVAIPGNLSADTLYRFEKIFASNYLQINGVAYTISVKKVNLANAPANITFTIPASWVDQRGGNEAVRITRISDETGMPEMINTTYEGLDAQGNMIFCGDSPGGTSLFGLLTLIHPFAVNAHHHFFSYRF
ncbi:IPT/TIG domain-containing protein [Methanoregula sp.]|uniref:IPT/TIG domain-containing protein n=1 Tax=Methanoregula sp. TaxID=2052170 RepID=UPI003BAE8A59